MHVPGLKGRVMGSDGQTGRGSISDYWKWQEGPDSSQLKHAVRSITPSLNLQGYIWHKRFHHIFPNLWGWIISVSPYKFVPTFCSANQAMTVLLWLKRHLNTPLSVSWHSLSSYFLSNGHLPWLCPSPLSPSFDFPLFLLQVGSSPDVGFTHSLLQK